MSVLILYILLSVNILRLCIIQVSNTCPRYVLQSNVITLMKSGMFPLWLFEQETQQEVCEVPLRPSASSLDY